VVLRVEVREPPPPEPEAEPAPTPERPPVHEAPSRRAPRVATNRPAQPVPPKTATPTERPARNPDETTANPVFGISMESTSAAGNGPAMAVGNTLQTRPRKPGEEAETGAAGQRLAAPVPAYEVTKMPLPKGECTGQYTSEAREQGLEGVVVFDLVVDEQGRVRDIKVVQGLAAGLTEAAKRALQTCQFTPGERDGKPVPVRIRSFKIRFTLRENE
jgi:TonB family protein